jgi:hypothetical protein
VDNAYTGTINFGNYKVYAGQGNLTGTIFDSGTSANYQCGSGGVQLYTSVGNTSGYNIVKANNVTMANVNVFMNSNAFGRYIDIQTDFYCNKLTIVAYSVYLSTRVINIHIYGGIEDSLSYNNSNISLNANGANIKIYLYGGNINMYNGLQLYNSLTIVNTVTLLHDINIYFQNTTNVATCGLYYDTNGSISCNGHNIIIYATGYNYNHNIYIDKAIDNLIICSTSNYQSVIRILTNLVVNNYFSIVEMPRPRSPYNYVRSSTNGTKVNITLGNDCKYLISWALLYDISFNKPVTAFNSSINNCDNIKVADYPQTIVSVK